MTTGAVEHCVPLQLVVEAYRLDRYDNFSTCVPVRVAVVVEAYRLDRYDNFYVISPLVLAVVVEAYRLDRYDNLVHENVAPSTLL